MSWRHAFFCLRFSSHRFIVSLFTALPLCITPLHYFFALSFCITSVNRHSSIMSLSSNFSSRQFSSSNSVNDDEITSLSEFSSSTSRVNQHDNQSSFAFDIFYANKQQHLQKTTDVITRKYSILHIEELTYIRWTFFINMQFQQWWQQIFFDESIKNKTQTKFKNFKWIRKNEVKSNAIWKSFDQLIAISDERSRIWCRTCHHLFEHFTSTNNFSTNMMKKHLIFNACVIKKRFNF